MNRFNYRAAVRLQNVCAIAVLTLLLVDGSPVIAQRPLTGKGGGGPNFPKISALPPSAGQGHGQSVGQGIGGGGGSHPHQSYRPDYDGGQHQHGGGAGHGGYGGHGNYGGGNSQLTISPYGLGFNFSNRNFGISVGSARYYQPSLGYYALPYSGYQADYYGDYGGAPYAYGSGYGSVYDQSGGYDPSNSSYVPSYYPAYPPTNAPLNATEAEAASRLFGNENVSGDPQIAAGSSTNGLPFPMISTKAVALRTQQRAEAAFRAGDYEQAAQLARQAVRLDKKNGLVHLFSSQTQFAIGDYKQAAQDLDQATKILTTDKWTLVVANFRSFYGRNDYVAQTNRLSQYLLEHPSDVLALTLRGFQYGCLGYADAAAQDFRAALGQRPKHELANRLLPVLGQVIAPPTMPASVDEPMPPGAGWQNNAMPLQLTAPENSVPASAPTNAPTADSPVQELPEPGSLEEIDTPPGAMRLVPEGETSVLDLEPLEK